MEVIMKIGAIIAEYNPFHNGHKYQIEKFKKESNLDYILIIMSGNFTQRGEPAWMSKHIRAKMALLNGADLVLELPIYYATGSASVFAEGAIAHLNALGCIDELCFGCEIDFDPKDFISNLEQAAQIIIDEPELFKTELIKALKNGYSYPAAREKALSLFIPKASALFSPNNILALEYMIALKKTQSKIQAKPIQRNGQGYHSLEFNDLFASASALRNKITDISECHNIKGIPNICESIIREQFNKCMPVYINDFSAMFAHVYMNTKDNLTKYVDVNDDIANLITKNIPHFFNLEQMLEHTKTKAYTYTRLSRCFIHLLTKQTKDSFNLYTENGWAFYARILGFKKDSSLLLRIIKDTTSIPLLTKVSIYKQQLDPMGVQLFEQDLYASELYRMTVQLKYGIELKNEFTESLVIV